MSRRLNVLLTNIVLNGRTGTEIVTRDVALGLLKAGHKPSIYTRATGPIAAELAAHGIPVETSIDQLGDEVDVIHGNHLVACVAVLARYPNTPAISVCHDARTWYDAPPRLPNIATYAAVSQMLAERVSLEAHVPASDIALLLNGVDIERFAPGPPPRPSPQTALAFAKNTEHVNAIQQTCAARGIRVDFIGSAVGNIVAAPEHILAKYDVVFASALSAIESMACLRPTIVCDGRGLAGMVDEARYASWRPHNFGVAVLTRALAPDNIAAELDRYDANESARVGERVRREASLPAWIAAHEELYHRAIDSFQPASPEIARRAWAHHIERWAPDPGREWQWVEERQQLLTALWQASSKLNPLPRNRRISFAVGSKAEAVAEWVGFTARDDNGVWTTQRFAGVRIHLGEVKDNIIVSFAYAVYLPAKTCALEITLLANGTPIESWQEANDEGWRASEREFVVPATEIDGLSTWLMFKLTLISDAPPPTLPGFSLRTLTVREL